MYKKVDKSAIGRMSRNKGGSFERQIVKILNEWVTSFSWGRNKRQDNQYEGLVRGDIIPEYSSFEEIVENPCVLAIECKKVEDWELSKLLSGKCKKVMDFWAQTEEQTFNTDFIPFLIFTKNRHQILCMFPYNIMYLIEEKLDPLTYFIWSDVVIADLNSFLECVKYADLIQAFQERKENKKCNKQRCRTTTTRYQSTGKSKERKQRAKKSK